MEGRLAAAALLLARTPEAFEALVRDEEVRRDLLRPEKLSVLVNGVLTALPAIHVSGNFLGYVSELWFLDQADNPLTLKYRISGTATPGVDYKALSGRVTIGSNQMTASIIIEPLRSRNE